MSARLELSGVRAGYGRIEILRGLDLVVPEGSVVAILGSNGVGKTTALRAISGVVPTTGGSIRFGGRRIDGRSIEDIAQAGLVMIPEGRGIFPGMSVEENLRLIHSGLAPDTAWTGFRDDAVDMFPRLGERLDQRAGSLSGGEQQMLAVTRAIAGHPRLVMFDELSMGLAPLIVEDLFARVAAMRDQGVTIVLVEQFMTYALDLADICFVMSKGRVTWAGESSELRARASAGLSLSP